MNKEIKKRWIEALRSGEYKQGTGQLCQLGRNGEEQFCCLGVLADVEYDGDWELKNNKYSINKCTLSLPNRFMNRVGLSFNSAQKLAELNDIRNLDFDKIADYIEKNE